MHARFSNNPVRDKEWRHSARCKTNEKVVAEEGKDDIEFEVEPEDDTVKEDRSSIRHYVW